MFLSLFFLSVNPVNVTVMFFSIQFYFVALLVSCIGCCPINLFAGRAALSAIPLVVRELGDDEKVFLV